MHEQTVKLRLDAWREAERRRVAAASLGASEREAAEEEARTAEKAFHAELAQASARYAEAAYPDRDRGWAEQMSRRACRS